LTKPNREFLSRLPKGPREVLPGVWIAHGSFVDEDTYMFSDFDAYQAFETGSFKVCFFGHTHYPIVFVQTAAGIDAVPLDGSMKELILEPQARYLINPGSVGQPRDRDPRAGFAEFYPESRRVVFYRVDYNAQEAAQKITRSGLPENLGNRLLVGT
jgi:diadenosine tetraphosphatase ApaH/serine/threonine PP2A family protein phosphatase